MSGIDLDAMRGRWQAANRDVDAQLALDVAAVRAALQGRTQAAFRRHSRWLLVSLACGALLSVLLLAFIAANADDGRYVAMAALLLVLAGAEFVVDWRQWRVMSHLDLDRPVLQVRAELDALRARRLAMTQWLVLMGFFLWLPMLLVAMKGFTGFDLLRVLHPDFIWINQAAMLVVIVLALGAARWATRRYGQAPGFQRLLDDVAGASWRKARVAFDANDRFEDEVNLLGAEKALAARTPAAPPVAAMAPLQALKRRLVLAIVASALLALGTGAFNGMHGGQWQYLVPSVMLHLFLIANLVAAILHLSLLARTDYRQPAEALAVQVAGYGALRMRFARWILVLAPIVVLLAMQVLGKAFVGVDAMALLPWRSLLVGAGVVSGFLFRLTRAGMPSWVERVQDVISFGALRCNQALAAALREGPR